MVGAFYYDQFSPNGWTMDGRDPTTDALVGRFWNYAQSTETQEYAVFANGKVKVTDKFDVQFGGRETRSAASSGANIESGLALLPPDNLGVPYTPGVSVSADQFTYMVSPAYHITRDVMAYARVATGFRPVTSNDPGSVALGAPKIVNPDTTTNYEVGLKGDFLDHALTIEAAAYRIDWQNIQLELIKSGFVYFGNGSGAQSQGFELTAHAKPTRSLTLDGWVSYDDAKVTRDFAQGQAGERLPFAPQFSAYGSAEQDFALSSSWTGYVGGDLAYVGQRTGIFIGIGDPRQLYPAYTKVDLRIGARTDLWSVELYTTNVGNSHAALDGGLGYVIPGVFIDIPPRTVGVSVARKF
jgi:outer membrane receptor protein involved in Fe transport